jgi:hypothetical protein
VIGTLIEDVIPSLAPLLVRLHITECYAIRYDTIRCDTTICDAMRYYGYYIPLIHDEISFLHFGTKLQKHHIFLVIHDDLLRIQCFFVRA